MRGKVKDTENTNSTPKPLSIPFKPSKSKSNSNSKSKSKSIPPAVEIANHNLKNVFDSPAFINPEFTHRRQWDLLTTTLYSLSSDTSATSWLFAIVDGDKPQLLHPLTLKPKSYTRPINPHVLFNSQTTSLTSFDKLVILPSKASNLDRSSTMVVLFGGGQLVARLPLTWTENRVNWVLFSKDKFDDIILCQGDYTYVVDRSGKLFGILHNIEHNLSRTYPLTLIRHGILGLNLVGYRKRLLSDFGELHLVVRLNVEVFRVFKKVGNRILNYWDEVKGFDGGKVLFVSKDCCFFMKGFGGREYENCIVFLESGFPRYGDDEWEYNGEDEIRVFGMSDGRYGKVGESVEFPEIDWSPPSWVFDNSETNEDGKVQEGMEEQDERHDSDIRDLEVGKMQCNSNSRDEGNTSLQEDVPASIYASMSTVEEEVTKTLLLMNGGNEPTDKEMSRECNTVAAPRACTSSSTSTKRHKSDHVTTKFEGFDIRSELVPTLQKIWRNHGNIIENCPMRISGIIANALESLATAVQILEDNSVESLSECQTNCLSTTLSDLRFMCFNVEWLSSYVEKAVKLHQSKTLVDSLKKLSQLSSQVKESRAMFLDKAAKLSEEEKKLEKEMARVSKLIPFSGEVKFDEPVGSGLT